MDMWLKIASAAGLGLMLVLLFPHARRMLSESPQPQKGDWTGVLIPVALVVLFVLALMSFV